MNVIHGRVRKQILNILQAWGMAGDLVKSTAEAMIETDLLGVDSHGISMLMTYEARMREGKLNRLHSPRRQSAIVRSRSTWRLRLLPVTR